MRRKVLVVDWGGGTLDLTLCRIEPGRVLQIHNHGSNQVGGDKFDEVIRDAVVARFSSKNGISASDKPIREARLRLLQITETNKIELSQEPSVTFFRPGYFPESGRDLKYNLSRQELDEITRPLVALGRSEIESLLEMVGISPAEISLCLVAGGMAAMPAIRSSLHELFGPEKVVVPNNSGTLVSQGAAWIAHDSQPLVLAKQIELKMARGFLLPLLQAGTAMPTLGEVKGDRFHLFCTDPSDGTAKFSIVAPAELSQHPQAADRRTSLGIVTIEVDKTAPPMVERLTLDVKIDDNLILSAAAMSSQRGDRSESSYYDLEFGIGLPGSAALGEMEIIGTEAAAPAGGLVARENVANRADQALVPGDVLYTHNPRAFQRLPGPNQATEDQLKEHLYYQPCGSCKRPWGDPDCSCAS
jgi:molecular chaperone DnaK